MTKDRKVKAYYPMSVIVEKPKTYTIKQYIHSESSGGFWCSMRDQSQSEKQANDAAIKNNAVVLTMAPNKEFMERWSELWLEDEKGNQYRIREKPDEYDYRSDIKVTAVKGKDDTYYNEARYRT